MSDAMTHRNLGIGPRIRALFVVLVAAFTLTSFGPATDAWACTCLAQADEEFFEGASAVFIGTAKLVSDGDPYVWDLAVESIQKGDLADHELVEIPLHEVDGCGFNFIDGRTYQVFAGESGDRLTTGICSGTRELGAQHDPFIPAGVTSREPPEPDPTTTTWPSTTSTVVELEPGNLVGGEGQPPVGAAAQNQASRGSDTSWPLLVILGATGGAVLVTLVRYFTHSG